MALAQAAVGTTATVIYTSSGETVTTNIMLMNNGGSAVVVQIFAVPNGQSAGNSTKIIKDLTIDAADTYILNTEKFVLADGDTIQVTCDTASSVFATTSFVGI